MAPHRAPSVARASLILANYNTAADTLRAVGGLQAQGLPVEIIVVDNASRPAERRELEALPRDVRVLWNDANLGYGGAINEALPLTRTPVIGFLNPDIVPFPGVLKGLLEALEREPRIGVVGPRTWWDAARTLLLPPIRLPSLTGFLVRWVGNVLPEVGLAYSRRTTRWMTRVGFGDRVSFLPMLSGAFLLARRKVIEEVGGFDPGFPMYFEDADWCRRVRHAGYRIAYVPSAEIVHHFDQSARQISAQAEAWRAQSLSHYLRKYYGRSGEWVYQRLEALGPRLSRRLRSTLPFPIEDLGSLETSPTLPLPIPEALVQVGYHWSFYEAAIGMIRKEIFRFPETIWEHLRPARYFARALDPRTFRPLRGWTWEKAP